MFKNESKKKASLRQGGKYAIDWNDYYGLEDVHVETYGYSFEGRPLKLIKISRAGANSPNILVEGGIHAREWISPAMTTYMIHSLLLDPKNDHYLDKFNFHIIPSANPDGYEFSRNDIYISSCIDLNFFTYHRHRHGSNFNKPGTNRTILYN
ncbi:Carboxypeptidase B [Caligus rogercresseyi]|uniref:Carboxypeptidase B n=1 Tax=Caligus rogercresseyi TaxID=217165 RepID=A0A7T8GNE6_CALRO|nr:Carboxypeptidase B [Caligus rogercresseyi]